VGESKRADAFREIVLAELRKVDPKILEQLQGRTVDFAKRLSAFTGAAINAVPSPDVDFIRRLLTSAPTWDELNQRAARSMAEQWERQVRRDIVQENIERSLPKLASARKKSKRPFKLKQRDDLVWEGRDYDLEGFCKYADEKRIPALPKWLDTGWPGGWMKAYHTNSGKRWTWRHKISEYRNRISTKVKNSP
jgi:hypothetical protein